MGFLPSLPWTLKVVALSLGLLSAHSGHPSTGEMSLNVVCRHS